MRENLADFEPSVNPEFPEIEVSRTDRFDIAQELGQLVFSVQEVGTSRLKQLLTDTEFLEIEAASKGLTRTECADGRGYKENSSKFLRDSISKRIPDKRLPALIYEALASGDIEFTPDKDKTDSNLTDRQREIAELICTGMANVEIAEQVGISINTVKDHMKIILKKLGIKSRLQIPRRMFETGEYKLYSGEDIYAAYLMFGKLVMHGLRTRRQNTRTHREPGPAAD